MTETVDIFGWLADRTGCGTIRVMQPLDALAASGDLTIAYDEKLKTKGFMPKVLIGQRVCKDGPTSLWQHVAGNEHRPKLVFEVDDDLWNVDYTNPAAHEWFINGHDHRTGERHDVQGNLRRNVLAADRVTVTTQALADIVGQWNDDVRVIPNRIPAWVLDWPRPRRDKVTVGWMGSSTHHMDWKEGAGYVGQFMRRNPEVQFHIIGGGYGSWFKLPEDQVVETPWIDTVEGCWETIDFDIGLAPLRPHLFNRSKSALKFLEYAALGIPTIASDVGPYSDHIRHGSTGFLVKRDHEWGVYLRQLVNDKAMRVEIGENAKAWARTQILENNLGLWKAALCEW
jgi:glycosyltransferase involved in cell wall biosynthesis